MVLEAGTGAAFGRCNNWRGRKGASIFELGGAYIGVLALLKFIQPST